MSQSSSENLDQEYSRMRGEAKRLAGEPGDLPQRAAILHSIYDDSGGNHAFPQIALHGALWAARFFSVTGTMGKIISYRYFYSPTERRRRHAMLDDFAEGFKTTNRSVFIDTYTNYYFSKLHGHLPQAAELIPPALLTELNCMHTAVRRGERLEASSHENLFKASLEWEQEVTVAPEIHEAIGRIDCPILTTLLLKPVVRFKYFRRFQYFLFRNFSDKRERIDKAVRAYQIARSVGWRRVVSTMRNYDKSFSFSSER